MENDELYILRFEPLALVIDRVGPFFDKPYEIDFTDSKNLPCNLFLFMSENGSGKTTILDIMACLMNLFADDSPKQFGHEDLDKGRGRAQWDILVSYRLKGDVKTIVLSIIAGDIGDETALKIWSKSNLTKLDAETWHRVGYRRRAPGLLQRIGRKDDIVEILTSTIKSYKNLPPEGFLINTLGLPTMLHFTAYRDIPPITDTTRSISEPIQWGYRPVMKFGSDGGQWNSSLDNLLVWLKWLDEGDSGDRFDRAIQLVNNNVFKGDIKHISGIRRQPPEAIVNSGGQKHRLDRLSSGEKNLVEMLLRIGTHLTRSTIVLIDEADVHLHPRWQHRLMGILKSLVVDNKGLTVIAATHSIDMLKAFAFEVPEDGLRKGGQIIEKNLR